MVCRVNYQHIWRISILQAFFLANFWGDDYVILNDFRWMGDKPSLAIAVRWITVP